MTDALRLALTDAILYAAKRVTLPPDLAEDVAALKATTRDPREPGRLEKMRMEKRLARLMRRVFARQAELIRQRAEMTAKADLDDWFTGEGWDEDEVAELIEILRTSARDGVALLAQQIGFDFDPTLTNTRAARWAQTWAGKLIKEIDDTTLKAVREAVRQFVETPGMTIGELMKMLPFEGRRAELVAVTETTRSYAEGNLEAGRMMAEEFPDVLVVKEWFTNNDDLVCPLCGPLNGEEIEIDEQFDAGGEDVDGPPRHPNCRCFLSVRTRING